LPREKFDGGPIRGIEVGSRYTYSSRRLRRGGAVFAVRSSWTHGCPTQENGMKAGRALGATVVVVALLQLATETSAVVGGSRPLD
jgi:hypothetical protein